VIIVSKDPLDKLIEEVISEEINEIEIPDGQQIWDRIEKGLNSPNKNKIKEYNYKKVSSLIIALITLSLFSHWKSKEINASYISLLKIISKMTGGKIEINIDSIRNSREKSRISIHDEVPSTVSLDMNTAEEQCSFQLAFPTYLPSGFEFKEVELEQLGNETLSAKIIYSNIDHSTFELVETPIKEEYSKNIGVNQESAKVETVNHNGFEYTVIEYKNNQILILWNIYDIEYTLRGNNKEEALKIAFSIKSTQ